MALDEQPRPPEPDSQEGSESLSAKLTDVATQLKIPVSEFWAWWANPSLRRMICERCELPETTVDAIDQELQRLFDVDSAFKEAAVKALQARQRFSNGLRSDDEGLI